VIRYTPLQRAFLTLLVRNYRSRKTTTMEQLERVLYSNAKRTHPRYARQCINMLARNTAIKIAPFGCTITNTGGTGGRGYPAEYMLDGDAEMVAEGLKLARKMGAWKGARA
jgi:hypothetical protein